MMEAIRSSETSVFARCTRVNISEDGILHSHSLENLKSYNCEFVEMLEANRGFCKVNLCL
jgi:hypothetical protein